MSVAVSESKMKMDEDLLAKVEGKRSVYSVKSIVYTIQGEGNHVGRAAVFLRFSGCNLWSGREEDRATAICQFCDTDFRSTDGPGGGKFRSAEELALRVASLWPKALSDKVVPYVVCTGGEPLLQLDEALIEALHQQGFEVAVETNGTQRAPRGIDWLCVSPKAGAEITQQSGDELKVVYPQTGMDLKTLAQWDFTHLYLQPMDGPFQEENIQAAAQFCMDNPQWKLSLQQHKMLGLP